MRIRIKKGFNDIIIKNIIIIVSIPIMTYIFKKILDNGRFVGTLIRKLIGN